MQYVLDTVGAAAAIILLGVVPKRLATSGAVGIHPDEPPQFSVVGGATWFTTWWPIGATWPLAQLDIYPWGLRIGPHFRWLKWALPTTELQWDQILRARLGFFGIRLKWRSSPPRWIAFGGGYGPFLPGVDPQVVVALREAGVEVEE
jgi:hypothetical protein